MFRVNRKTHLLEYVVFKWQNVHRAFSTAFVNQQRASKRMTRYRLRESVCYRILVRPDKPWLPVSTTQRQDDSVTHSHGVCSVKASVRIKNKRSCKF